MKNVTKKRTKAAFLLLILTSVTLSITIAVPIKSQAITPIEPTTKIIKIKYAVTDDAYINKGHPNTNRGSRNYMVVRNTYGYGGSSHWAWESLVKFDLTQIVLMKHHLKDAKIVSATLKLYYYRWKDNYPAGRELSLYRLTNDWSEKTVTWNTKPSSASEATDIAVVPNSTGVWIKFNVTKDLKENLENSLFGWKITDNNYWGNTNIPIVFFRTKEYGSYIPTLEVKVQVTLPHQKFQDDGQAIAVLR